MNFLTYILINGPFVILNMVANAFYIFCMVCPLHGERIKQPLKLLLGSLTFSTKTCMMSMSMTVFSLRLVENDMLTQISHVLVLWSLYATMTTSVWLSFLYCTQIVPAQRALFIWIKKNIKRIIYCIWLVERIFSLSDFTVLLINTDGFGLSNNFSVDHDILQPARASSKWFEDTIIILLSIKKTHFSICMCVMVMSSGSTVVYLSRHIRRMVANGQPLSCPRFRGQMRVTITGILQGVLYVICCAVWIVYRTTQPSTSTLNRLYVHFTAFNVYMSGTTFSLGAGQGVFRQRAADIWLRAAQCCKTPKVQESEQGG